ncbi:MAG: hypothetical protein IH613_05390 [Desulfuromonadales bacterium]|nr:hypothetical protein [Desulfuromonadales bacterium]
MKIDYVALLPEALKAMYPEPSQRNEVESKLEAYGQESFHREQPRVRLGVLYLASQEPEKFDSFIELACTDYRDLLCAAEYPHSSKRGRLRENDPKKYKNLHDKEEKEYLAWVESIKKALTTP